MEVGQFARREMPANISAIGFEDKITSYDLRSTEYSITLENVIEGFAVKLYFGISLFKTYLT